jgi:hypothetical protein
VGGAWDGAATVGGAWGGAATVGGAWGGAAAGGDEAWEAVGVGVAVEAAASPAAPVCAPQCCPAARLQSRSHELADRQHLQMHLPGRKTLQQGCTSGSNHGDTGHLQRPSAKGIQVGHT